jgi:phage tail protein X
VNAKIVNEVITDLNGKGEEKPSSLKWIIPPAALPVFIILFLFFYFNKTLILSKAENILSRFQGVFISKVEKPDVPRPTVGDSFKEQTEPPADKPEIPQTERNTPAKEKIEPSEEKTISGHSKTSSPIIRTVKKGDNLLGLTKKVYGRADDRLVAMVQQHNPWIIDMDNLPIGVEILFPELLEEKAKAKP